MTDLMETRDAFADYRDTPSRLLFEIGRAEGGRALVTIAIPTYRRPRLLVEAIRSAVAQTMTVPLDVIVVDNAPDDSAVDALRDTVVLPPHIRLRYFGNTANLGMFGNWNRAIEKAETRWVTLLNDDDLLAPEFLARMESTFGLEGATGGLACQKTSFDERKGETPDAARHARRFRDALFDQARFLGADRREVRPRNLFWDCIVGNGLGFLFERDKAIALGGYQPEDFPSADYFFAARYASRFGLSQARARLASVRIEDNETLKVSTLEATVRQNARLRELILAAGEAPPRWRRWSPWIVAHQVRVMERLADSRLDPAVTEPLTGAQPRRRPLPLLLALRLLHRSL
ncbi:MAG: glycosyltransferase family 2 protein [Brevundimonas sp.]